MIMIIEFFKNLYTLFLSMSPYIVLGLILVGILNTYINRKWIVSQIGSESFGSVVKASLIGVPLPLCSCGVVPTAIELKRSGASNGAVISFLISTPQTGIDSIIATYGMMGPVVAVFRPLAAFASGILGGAFANTFAKKEKIITEKILPASCCDGKEEKCHSCNEHEHHSDCKNENSNNFEKPHTCSCCCDEHNNAEKSPPKAFQKFNNIFKYAFGSFLEEISVHFIIGLIVAAIITTIIPNDFFVSYGIGNRLFYMLLMAAIGIPMYICSTSSIPIALSLILKGISPGAAFVFLFAGPAANIASITVLGKALGKKLTAIYILTITVLAIFFGLIFDMIAENMQLSFKQYALIQNTYHEISVLTYMLSAVFLIFLIRGAYRHILHK